MKNNQPYTPIQIIFLASKCNGAIDVSSLMPACAHNGIELPRETWLSRRLEELRKGSDGAATIHRRPDENDAL